MAATRKRSTGAELRAWIERLWSSSGVAASFGHAAGAGSHPARPRPPVGRGAAVRARRSLGRRGRAGAARRDARPVRGRPAGLPAVPRQPASRPMRRSCAARPRPISPIPTPEQAGRLAEAAEPPRQELLRRMNLAPGGTAALVAMRQDLLAALREQPALQAARRRPAPPVRLLVQPRLPGTAPDRLEQPGRRPGEADHLRGGARDRRLGRSAPPPRPRPPLLRLLPPGAARRAADLRRGRADRGPRRRGAAAAGPARGRPRRRRGRRTAPTPRSSIPSPTARKGCAACPSAIS